jgi:hypothetical protein
MARLRPRFWLTFVPGCSTVPLEDLDRLRTCNSSMQTSAWFLLIVASVCTDFAAELVAFDGADDHVHLLVHYPPKVSVSTLVNSLKGVSSRMIRKQNYPSIRNKLWGAALWSPVLLRR